MPKRRYYQHRSDNHKLLSLMTAAALLCGGLYYGYRHFVHFNPQDIVVNSVLKEKTFATKVKEVVSPKQKIKAYLFEDKTNPIISVNFMFKNSGLANDNDTEVGLANMVAALLTTGSGELDRIQFQEELEKRAISISFSASRDEMNGALLTTKAQAGKAYRLLKNVLAYPRFDEADIEQVKAERLVMLKQQSEHPDRVLGLEANEILFGNHPYSRNPLGKASDIIAISRSQVAEYVKNHFTRNNLIVGIAGDISTEEAGKMLDDVFGSLPDSGRTAFVRKARIDYQGGDRNIDKNLPQSIARFVAPGVTRSDKDFYPLYVANHVLGGSGLTSRLSLAAREKEALTYGVYTYMSTADKAPMLAGSFSATPENFSRVKKIVKNEWQKMGDRGVSQEELVAAKEYLLASYNLRFASITDIAEILTAMQKEDLGIDFLQKRNDYIRNIKLTEVNTAAKKFFDNKNLRFITIGNKGAGKE